MLLHGKFPLLVYHSFGKLLTNNNKTVCHSQQQAVQIVSWARADICWAYCSYQIVDLFTEVLGLSLPGSWWSAKKTKAIGFSTY